MATAIIVTLLLILSLSTGATGLSLRTDENNNHWSDKIYQSNLRLDPQSRIVVISNKATKSPSITKMLRYGETSSQLGFSNKDDLSFSGQPHSSSDQSTFKFSQTKTSTSTKNRGTSFQHQLSQRSSCPQVCRCDFTTGMTNCSRNGLENIPSGIPLNTTQLELAYNNLNDIPNMVFSEFFQLQELGLGGNNLGLDSFHPSSFKTRNSTLLTLDLINSNFPVVPPYLPPSITCLYLIQCGIQTLRNDSFLETPLLEHLDLSNNQISILPGDVFKPLTNLNVLYISFNQISQVPDGMFWGNKMLNILSFRFNHLKKIPTGREMYPLGIQHLDFVGNPITTVKSRTFENLTALQTLEIWQCGSLTVVEDYAFAGLGQLQILDITDGNISSRVTNNTFNGLAMLQTLYVYGHKIPSIDVGAMLPMKSLRSLWIQDNKLSTLKQGTISKVTHPNLSEVYIEFNPWVCDCHLRWLREEMDKGDYTVMDPHLIVCAGPARVKGKSWDQLKPSDFICP